MRLMNKDLKEFTLYRNIKVKNDYVGTNLEEKEICKFSAVSKPVSDKIYAEMYGERINNMIQLTVLRNGLEILDGDIFVDLNNSKYKVVSVNKYTEHLIITGEKNEID